MKKHASLASRKKRERVVNAVCFVLVVFFAALCMLPIW